MEKIMVFMVDKLWWMAVILSLFTVVIGGMSIVTDARADITNDDGEIDLQMYRRQVIAEENQAKALESIAKELKEIKQILKKR